jgi:hypothetical protein
VLDHLASLANGTRAGLSSRIVLEIADCSRRRPQHERPVPKLVLLLIAPPRLVSSAISTRGLHPAFAPLELQGLQPIEDPFVRPFAPNSHADPGAIGLTGGSTATKSNRHLPRQENSEYTESMPITLPELVEHIKAIGWNHEVDAERGLVHLGFGTSNHVDLDGDKHIAICIELACDGQYLQVILPRVYNLANCKFKGAALAALTNIAYMTRSLQCEYDPQDGEVRYAVDMWVLDAKVTQSQVEMMVRIVVELLEEYEPVVRHAMEHGKVDLSLRSPRKDDEKAEEKQEPAPLPPEIAELVKKAGGIDALRAALERSQGNS